MRLLSLLLPRFLVVSVLLAAPVRADQIRLHPPASAVELRSYGFGLFPLDGQFTRFDGWMRTDPSHRGACEVMLDVEPGSLVMGSDAIRDRIIGPGMMDAVRFPALSFQGACQGTTVVGALTMHGETHPFSLDYSRAGGKVTATGRLRRAEWGITGSALIGGPVIRIRVVIPDPFGPLSS
jgi:polyisoprenoid-binding protein YceI